MDGWITLADFSVFRWFEAEVALTTVGALFVDAVAVDTQVLVQSALVDVCERVVYGGFGVFFSFGGV